MTIQIPQHASAVVIGGGVIGASVAYHLSKQEWTDIVLLEHKQFLRYHLACCGSGWHDAGERIPGQAM